MRSDRAFARKCPWRDWSTRLLQGVFIPVMAILSVLTPRPSLAGDIIEGNALTDEELDKTYQVIGLLKCLLADCLDMTLEEIFNPPNQSQKVEYETIDNEMPTLGEAIDELSDMVDSERIRTGALHGPTATTDVKPGTKSDRIIISTKAYKEACRTNDEDRVRGQLELGFVLMNEMVHVYQKFEGDDLKQCDAERDSDDSSLKFINAVIEAVTNGQGDPYTDINDVEPECLRKYLVREEVGDEDGIEKVAKRMQKWQKKIQKRKEDTFQNRIDQGISWGKKYYGSSKYKKPIQYGQTDFIPPMSTTMSINGGETTRTYPVPPGMDLINSVVAWDDQQRVVLTSIVGDDLGNRELRIWIDTDGDDLPELPEAIPAFPLPPGPLGDPPPLSVMVFDAFPDALSVEANDNGMLLLDTVSGEIHLLELGLDELPVGPAQTLFADPLLTDGGGFVYFTGYSEPASEMIRFIFGNVPNVAQFGHAAAIFFDVPVNGDPVIPATAPGLTHAQAMDPFSPLGIQYLTEGYSNGVVLTANPGETVTFFSVGHGVETTLASGLAGSDGLTNSLVASPPIAGNDLFRYAAGTRQRFNFLPRLGRNISCAMNDENGDGLPERLHLSVDPPRLHMLVGVDGNPVDDPVKTHVYEMALAGREPYGIVNWADPSGRVLIDADGDHPLIPVPGVDPPRYVEEVVDLDNNGSAEEGIVLSRPTAGPGFTVDVYAPMSGPLAGVTQSIDLSPSAEPDGHRIADLNGDGALDMAIYNRVSQRAIFLINTNDGLGTLVLIVPGDTDWDTDLDQEDLGRIQECFTGVGSGPVAPACGIADIDGDDDVDEDDLALFEACASGAGIPADPACAE